MSAGIDATGMLGIVASLAALTCADALELHHELNVFFG